MSVLHRLRKPSDGSNQPPWYAGLFLMVGALQTRRVDYTSATLAVMRAQLTVSMRSDFRDIRPPPGSIFRNFESERLDPSMHLRLRYYVRCLTGWIRSYSRAGRLVDPSFSLFGSSFRRPMASPGIQSGRLRCVSTPKAGTPLRFGVRLHSVSSIAPSSSRHA